MFDYEFFDENVDLLEQCEILSEIAEANYTSINKLYISENKMKERYHDSLYKDKEIPLSKRERDKEYKRLNKKEEKRMKDEYLYIKKYRNKSDDWEYDSMYD